jgi:rhamnulokinase
LLSQLTADAIGRRVITGPVEATATGNIIMQAMALGHLASLEEGRQMVRNSFEVITFEPVSRAGWDDAYAGLLSIMAQTG